MYNSDHMDVAGRRVTDYKMRLYEVETRLTGIERTTATFSARLRRIELLLAFNAGAGGFGLIVGAKLMGWM